MPILNNSILSAITIECSLWPIYLSPSCTIPAHAKRPTDSTFWFDSAHSSRTELHSHIRIQLYTHNITHAYTIYTYTLHKIIFKIGHSYWKYKKTTPLHISVWCASSVMQTKTALERVDKRTDDGLACYSPHYHLNFHYPYEVHFIFFDCMLFVRRRSTVACIVLFVCVTMRVWQAISDRDESEQHNMKYIFGSNVYVAPYCTCFTYMYIICACTYIFAILYVRTRMYVLYRYIYENGMFTFTCAMPYAYTLYINYVQNDVPPEVNTEQEERQENCLSNNTYTCWRKRARRLEHTKYGEKCHCIYS